VSRYGPQTILMDGDTDVVRSWVVIERNSNCRASLVMLIDAARIGGVENLLAGTAVAIGLGNLNGEVASGTRGARGEA